MCGRATCWSRCLYLEKGGSGRVDDLVEHLDADQRVLVGGVAVEELVLDQAGEGAELREEAAEEAELVHHAQRAADLPLAREDGQQRLAHGGLVDEAPVDHVEPAAQAQLKLRPEVGVVLLGEQEDAYQPQRLLGKRVVRESLELAVLQHEAVDLLAVRGGEGQEGPLGRRLAVAAEPVADRVAEVVEQRRVLVVVAHERLHLAQDGAVLVAEGVGDLGLQPQGEHVAGALLQVVKLGAHAQQEIVGAVELLALGGGEQRRVDEGLGVGQPALDAADPEQVLVIAQAAAAALDVGLLEKGGVARFFMALVLVADAPGQVVFFLAVQAAPLEGLLVFGEERLVAGQPARFQQRGLGAQVVVGLGHDLLQRARGVADLEADVPKHVEDMLDDVVDLLGFLRRGGLVKEENVDVAVGIELAAAEAAHGHERDGRRLVHVRAQVRFPRAVPQVPQHDGDDVGALAAEVAPALAVHVLELEPMLLELEEAPVDVEQVGRPQVGLMDQLPLGMAQDLLEIDGRHR